MHGMCVPRGLNGAALRLAYANFALRITEGPWSLAISYNALIPPVSRGAHLRHSGALWWSARMRFTPC